MLSALSQHQSGPHQALARTCTSSLGQDQVLRVTKRRYENAAHQATLLWFSLHQVKHIGIDGIMHSNDGVDGTMYSNDGVDGAMHSNDGVVSGCSCLQGDAL